MPLTAVEETLSFLRTLAPGRKTFPLREALRDDESRWFNAAVKQGVVSFRDCASDCFRLRKWKVPGIDEFETPAGVYRHLFSAPHQTEAWLNREYVSHIGAYARAILEFGYDAGRSSFSLYRKFTRDLITKKSGVSYETDAEFYDDDGSIHLQIEAKASSSQVAKIVSQLTGADSFRELPLKTVKKIEYVLDLRPRYFWVVGPGAIDPASSVFAVIVRDRNASFARLDNVPPPPR